MRDDSNLDKGSGGNILDTPATQAERRAILRAEAGAREPTTYAEIARGEDDLGGRWYPAGPAWCTDAAAQPKEAPLGVNVNWLPDCSGIGGRDSAQWPSEFEPNPTSSEETDDAEA